MRERLFCTINRATNQNAFQSYYVASFIGRDGLGRADIRLSAAGEPEGGRGKAVIRRQSGGRVRGLVPRTYRPGAPGALGGRAPSNGELAVKRPPDMAIPLKADMEPTQYVPPERGFGLVKLVGDSSVPKPWTKESKSGEIDSYVPAFRT